MAKKQPKFEFPAAFLRFIILVLFVGVTGLLIYNGILNFFTTSPHFRTKAIVIDPELQFINSQDLSRLLGKNIFTIDVREVQRNLSYKYPQVAQLKIVKRLPDQILLKAKKRLPFAQTAMRNKMVVLDDEGVVLSVIGQQDAALPSIIGLDARGARLVLGLPLEGRGLDIALKLIKSYKGNLKLSPWQIKEIDISNLSQVSFNLSNQLKVIIDENRIDQNLQVLGFVLSQRQIDLKEVKYLDLRFKEPIVGKADS